MHSRTRRAIGGWLAIALGTVCALWAAGGQLTLTMLAATLLVSGTFAMLVLAWWRERLGQALLALVSTSLVLLAAEGVLRWVPLEDGWSSSYSRLFSPDPELGWRMRPGANELVSYVGEYETQVRINPFGYRDAGAVQAAQHSELYRVAVLGDSFVANLGTEESDTFVSRLTQRTEPTCYFGNFGVGGYNQVQQLRTLDEIVQQYRPSLVLLVVYLGNDLDENVGLIETTTAEGRPIARWSIRGELEFLLQERQAESTGEVVRQPHSLATTVDHWLHGSRIHRLLRNAMYRVLDDSVSIYGHPAVLRYARHDLAEPERQAIEATQQLLQLLADKCQSHEIAFGVVLAPSLWEVDELLWNKLLDDHGIDPRSLDRNRPYRILEEHCQARGWPCKSLLSPLQKFSQRGERLYYAREQHWNEQGNQRVAEILDEWLRSQELIPPASE